MGFVPFRKQIQRYNQKSQNAFSCEQHGARGVTHIAGSHPTTTPWRHGYVNNSLVVVGQLRWRSVEWRCSAPSYCSNCRVVSRRLWRCHSSNNTTAGSSPRCHPHRRYHPRCSNRCSNGTLASGWHGIFRWTSSRWWNWRPTWESSWALQHAWRKLDQELLRSCDEICCCRPSRWRAESKHPINEFFTNLNTFLHCQGLTIIEN